MPWAFRRRARWRWSPRGSRSFGRRSCPGPCSPVAASHLRIGTFEYCAARGDHEALAMLVEYALARHYPALHGSPTPALALLAAVRGVRRARGGGCRWGSFTGS